ncbi:MAG TPA: hypothetical protein VGR09_07840, partial [Gemmatimonadales bacterium]|nr:hypothetical protein [Gemmatimonadales bacterium]
TLGTRSPTTLFRRLGEIEYLTSFTHARRFYTLPHIPSFDAFGLWFYQGIGFSRHGTLKATLPALVSASDLGLFYREFKPIVHIPVYPTLLTLTAEKLLMREYIPGRGLLYLSADEATAKTQLENRRLALAREKALREELPATLVIESLLEIIASSQMRPLLSPQELASRLVLRGVPATVEQLEQVFERFGLKKKRT